MTSRFNADKKRPFAWWQILIFALLIIGFLIILFPPKLFMSSLMNNSIPSEVSISYLKNIIAKDPNNIPIKIVLAEQEIKMDKILEAKQLIEPYVSRIPKSETQWRLLWIYYKIKRIETFALPAHSAARIKNTAILQALLPVFIKSPYLTANQAALIAEDSLALDLPYPAVQFYKIAIKKNIKKPASFFANAGKSMLYVNDYKDSANCYLLAMKYSALIDDKRKYLFKGVDSLMASGAAENALAFAQKNIDGLYTDTETLTYLTKLSLMAQKDQVADEYVSRLLQLQYRE